MGIDDRLAHRHHRRVAVQPPLERPPEDAAQRRAREPGMEGGDDRQPQIAGGLGCHQPERRVEAAVHVDDVDALAPEQRPEVAAERDAGGDPRERPGAVDRPAGADAADEGRFARCAVQIDAPRGRPHVRRHHDRGMAPPLKLERQVVNVLGDAAEMG